MTKYILHGGKIATEDFYKELTKDIPDGGVVLFVYFARLTDEYKDRIPSDIDKCKKYAGDKKIEVVVATEENFIQEIDKADAIFLRGGSTEKLLNTLKAYPSLKEHFKGKTVIGSSAGAYVLSTFYASHYEDIVAEGLDIVPVRVATHYQSEEMPPRKGSVEALRKVAQDLRLILLKEGEFEVVRT